MSGVVLQNSIAQDAMTLGMKGVEYFDILRPPVDKDALMPCAKRIPKKVKALKTNSIYEGSNEFLQAVLLCKIEKSFNNLSIEPRRDYEYYIAEDLDDYFLGAGIDILELDMELMTDAKDFLERNYAETVCFSDTGKKINVFRGKGPLLQIVESVIDYRNGTYSEYSGTGSMFELMENLDGHEPVISRLDRSSDND